jgi:ABC-type Fe3+-siderophore transport system permease subunit
MFLGLVTVPLFAFGGALGIISFVGLMIPHIVRLVVDGDYRRVLPLSALLGAPFFWYSPTSSPAPLFRRSICRSALSPGWWVVYSSSA